MSATAAVEIPPYLGQKKASLSSLKLSEIPTSSTSTSHSFMENSDSKSNLKSLSHEQNDIPLTEITL